MTTRATARAIVLGWQIFIIGWTAISLAPVFSNQPIMIAITVGGAVFWAVTHFGMTQE